MAHHTLCEIPEEYQGDCWDLHGDNMVLTTANEFVRQFWTQWRGIKSITDQRIGQAYMNFCRQNFYELYQLLSDSRYCDCFYDDDMFDLAIDFTYNNW